MNCPFLDHGSQCTDKIKVRLFDTSLSQMCSKERKPGFSLSEGYFYMNEREGGKKKRVRASYRE